MESFVTIVNGFEPLTIVAKLSILQDPGYTREDQKHSNYAGINISLEE